MVSWFERDLFNIIFPEICIVLCSKRVGMLFRKVFRQPVDKEFPEYICHNFDEPCVGSLTVHESISSHYCGNMCLYVSQLLAIIAWCGQKSVHHYNGRAHPDCNTIILFSNFLTFEMIQMNDNEWHCVSKVPALYCVMSIKQCIHVKIAL